MMEAFSALLDDLYFTNSTKAKETILAQYLRTAPDPDRGWALAAPVASKRELIERVARRLWDRFMRFSSAAR